MGLRTIQVGHAGAPRHDTTASAPSSTRRSDALSSTSAARNSAPANVGSSRISLPERLTDATRRPCESAARTTRVPTKPVPPTTTSRLAMAVLGFCKDRCSTFAEASKVCCDGCLSSRVTSHLNQASTKLWSGESGGSELFYAVERHSVARRSLVKNLRSTQFSETHVLIAILTRKRST